MQIAFTARRQFLNYSSKLKLVRNITN